MIVFPMAGLSSRFAKAGYEQPKYTLPLWGHTVFDHAVASFRPNFADQPFLFIYRETGGVRAFLEERLRDLGVKSPRYAQLDQETAGQAETVELGLLEAGVGEAEPLTIFNIDTFRKPDIAVRGLPSQNDGWLEVFRGSGDNWSFVKPSGEPGIAAQTAEKVPISDLCCTGLYHFGAHRLFRHALALERKQPQSRELYVAPIYNHLIGEGARIGYGVVEQEDIFLCGVPAEYEGLLARDPAYAI